MKFIDFRTSDGVFSMDQLGTIRIFNSMPRMLWAVECRETDGVSLMLIDECSNHSRRWTGWTFLSPNHTEVYEQTFNDKQTVPVLLFEDQEDAFWAEMRYGSGQRLNTPTED